MSPSCFPPTVLFLDASLPSAGSSGPSSPVSTVLSRRCDFPTPFPPRSVAFAWRYHGCTRVLLPARPSAHRAEPGVVHPVPPAGISPRRRQDLLRSWGTPNVPLPCSPTPVGPSHQAFAMRRRGPRSDHNEGSHDVTFEAPSHSFSTGCLRFAAQVALPPRKTRFRPLAKLYRTGFPPAGFHRKVSSCILHFIPLSQAFVAQGQTLFFVDIA